MIPLPFWLQVVLFSVLFVFSLFAHERGHYLMLKKHYPSAEEPRWYPGKHFFVGVSWPAGAISTEEEIDVFLYGIMLGFIGLLPLLFLLGPWWFLGSLGVYLVGSRHDLVELWRRV